MKILLIIVRNIIYSGRLYFICLSTIPNIGGGMTSKKSSTTIKREGTAIKKGVRIWTPYSVLCGVLFRIYTDASPTADP